MNNLNYLYSIRARHVADIINGKKTIELRKSAPKPPFVMWVYCTKARSSSIITKECLYEMDVERWEVNGCEGEKPKLEDYKPAFYKNGYDEISGGKHGNDILNGLVVAKCVVDKIDKYYLEHINGIEITFRGVDNENGCEYSKDIKEELLKGSCLTFNEIFDYGHKRFDGAQSVVYALHLTQVEILDKPMTVQDFGLTRAPQSYQKVIAPEWKEEKC